MESRVCRHARHARHGGIPQSVISRRSLRMPVTIYLELLEGDSILILRACNRTGRIKNVSDVHGM